MKPACVITVDGIMQRSVSSAPVIVGINLYKSLSELFTVLLVSDQRQEQLDHWLKLENLTLHGGTIYNDYVLEQQTAENRRKEQIAKLRGRGYDITLIFDPSPPICAELLRGGYNVCLFSHASYADPSWRPDFEGKLKDWEEIEREVDAQAMLRFRDNRMREIEKLSGDADL